FLQRVADGRAVVADFGAETVGGAERWEHERRQPRLAGDPHLGAEHHQRRDADALVVRHRSRHGLDEPQYDHFGDVLVHAGPLGGVPDALAEHETVLPVQPRGAYAATAALESPRGPA